MIESGHPCDGCVYASSIASRGNRWCALRGEYTQIDCLQKKPRESAKMPKLNGADPYKSSS